WDVDGDTFPGEWGSGTEDFATGGIDRNCEVGVGRVPYYGTISDLDGILQKVITYETVSGTASWREKLLIPGAISNFSPEDYNNDGDTADSGELTNPSDRSFADPWGEALKSMATGAGYSPYTLYEKSGVYSDGRAYPLTACNAALSKANIQSEWLNQYGFVTWWGHGSSTGAYQRRWINDATRTDSITQFPQETSDIQFWGSADCSVLNDSYPSFVVQVSCTNGQPETTNNLGYSLLKTGAEGTFSATRVSWYGIGTWSTSWGASVGDNASYAYRIFDRMANSKDYSADALNDCRSNFGTAWGWQTWMNMLDFNLYGPPAATQVTLPAAPTNPGAINITVSQIRWTWTDNSSNETGFKVYTGAGATAPATVTQTTGADAVYWDHSGLSANTQYAMQVAAANTSGDSAKTANLAKHTMIEAVSGLTCTTVTTDSISMQSANMPSNLSSGASGLLIANTTTAANSGWRQDNSPWTSSGLSPDTPYTFSGTSRNGDGTETAPFTGASKYTLANTPVAPAVSNPTAGSLDVAISASDGNPATTTYAIQISPSVGGGSWAQAGGSVGVSPMYQTRATWGTITVTGLAEGTVYTFSLRARNANFVVTGLGPGASGRTKETTPPTPGLAVSNSCENGCPFGVSYSGAQDNVGGSGLHHVELWYKSGSGGTWTNSGLTSSAGSGAFGFTAPGSAPSNNGGYCFDLVAEDNDGNRSAAASGDGDDSTIYDTQNPNTPGAPSDEGMYSATATLSFTWTAASDPGGSGVASHDYEIDTDPSFPTAVASGNVPSATTSVGFVGA
ncbi:MAG: hypothetical protein NTW86_16110, partial [Candidatus Sumerlaeota bacterium]|nr:hypothetical protein [Candidatus Sumerlaeota bacterium]